MRKARWRPAFLLLLQSVALPAGVSGGFSGRMPGQDQAERPRFYARRVVSEKNVLNPRDCLGAPDGRFAEILAGGQVSVVMPKKLLMLPIIGLPSEGMGPIPDCGSVVGKGGMDFALEAWCPMQDAEGKLYYDWIPLAVSATGFTLLPPPNYSFDDSPGVDTIRITNTGAASAFVDAVIGYDNGYILKKPR